MDENFDTTLPEEDVSTTDEISSASEDSIESTVEEDDMTEDFIEDALLIRRSGRLISIELDIQ